MKAIAKQVQMNVLSESGGKQETEQEAETILSLVRNCSFTRNNADTGTVCDRIQVADCRYIFTRVTDILRGRIITGDLQ